MALKPRQAVLDIPAYKPAKNLEEVQRQRGLKKITKLAGNENTLGVSESVLESFPGITSRYPDPGVYELSQKLIEIHGVTRDQLIFGNGSFELIYLVALAFLEPGDESIISEPSFIWYKNVTQIMGGKIVSVPLNSEYKVDLAAIEAAITDRTKVIWICNPNNPTGTFLTEDELVPFLDRIRDDIVVVLDEAYEGFVEDEGFPNSIKLVEKYNNIAVFRTFSKLEGLANFRLGYGIADPEMISFLDKVRMPINTNGPAQTAALRTLNDPDFIKKSAENVRIGRQMYYKAFDAWGVSYVRSNTNFLFFDTGIDSKEVVDFFEERGVLVRGGFTFGYPTALRVSIGTPEENQLVLDILAELLDKQLP